MAVWFRQFYGIPDKTPRSLTIDDLTDDTEDDGSADTPPGVFDSPDYDDISADEAIAFAAGDYTPNGWLQGKNLRILPLGGWGDCSTIATGMKC
jgi:predicted oxidoreductase